MMNKGRKKEEKEELYIDTARQWRST